MCLDYRSLNMMTKKDVYPIPRIDNLLDRLTNATISTKIDLPQGYHQVKTRPDDHFKSAFISYFELFEWDALPFGLMNAPSTFWRLMNTTLSDLLDCFVLVYLDNILVYNSSNDEHKHHLRCVFDHLCKHMLYAKLSKWEFGVLEFDYLGHIVGSGQVHADPTKISAVKDWPVPTSVKHV